MTEYESTLPLQGIRVLEFGHAVMGPACGMILADLGADVIHVEPPEGDYTRQLRGFGMGYSSFFNRNKKSLAVNIKSAEGKEILYKLSRIADVVLENFGPGTMERLGFGYETLSAANPRLVYCSLKGFLSGPYENRHALDEAIQMMSGLAYMTGPPGQPLRAGTSILDITGGMFGVIGILTALYQRRESGKGRLIRSALFETAVYLMGQHMAYAVLSGEPVPPMPARISAWSVYRIFETADQEQVFIGVISDRHWERFCRAFERPDLFRDERLSTNNKRIAEREWLLPEIETIIQGLTKSEVIQRCEEADIPFAPIVRPEDLFNDPHLSRQGSMVDTEFPGGIHTRMPRIPIEYATIRFGLRLNPPDVGANSSQILQELGYSKGAIDALRAKGVISTARHKANRRFKHRSGGDG